LVAVSGEVLSVTGPSRETTEQMQAAAEAVIGTLPGDVQQQVAETVLGSPGRKGAPSPLVHGCHHVGRCRLRDWHYGICPGLSEEGG
jgi:hypothetical protein